MTHSYGHHNEKIFLRNGSLNVALRVYVLYSFELNYLIIEKITLILQRFLIRACLKGYQAGLAL